MLVMSRRKDEKIVFPGLGITVTLLNVKGNTARLGIDAPREITVLRDELGQQNRDRSMSQRSPHGMRNVLNSINLFVMLYQRQMEAGQVDQAASTFMKMVDYLERQTQQGNIEFTVDNNQTTSLAGEVMVVEDDHHQRDLLTDLLSTYGLNVTAFENGHGALANLHDGYRPEIVILDWNMPQFGGEWLVPKIRREFGEATPKLFVLSGTEKRPGGAEIDAWLAKPVNHEALLARIRAAYAAA